MIIGGDIWVTLIGGETGLRIFDIIGWRSSIVKGLYEEREVEDSSRLGKRFAYLGIL